MKLNLFGKNLLVKSVLNLSSLQFHLFPIHIFLSFIQHIFKFNLFILLNIAGLNQKRLLDDIFRNYSIHELPTISNEIVKIEIGLTIQQIIDIVKQFKIFKNISLINKLFIKKDEKHEVMYVNGWLDIVKIF